jgi:hypothetical protein
MGRMAGRPWRRAWAAIEPVVAAGGLVTLLWHNDCFNEPEYREWQWTYEAAVGAVGRPAPWCASGDGNPRLVASCRSGKWGFGRKDRTAMRPGMKPLDRRHLHGKRRRRFPARQIAISWRVPVGLGHAAGKRVL